MPPRLAVWIVDLFAPPREAEAILGDLLEEFTSVAATRGRHAARWWYWRQALKTTAYLVFTQGRQAPWSFAAVVVLGWYLPWMYGYYYRGGAVERIVTAIHYRWDVYRYIDAYAFWLIYAGLVGSLLVPMFVGWLVAVAMRLTPMTAAFVLALSGTLYPALRMTWGSIRSWPAKPFLARVQRDALIEAWILHALAFTAILIGGAIARKYARANSTSVIGPKAS